MSSKTMAGEELLEPRLLVGLVRGLVETLETIFPKARYSSRRHRRN